VLLGGVAQSISGPGNTLAGGSPLDRGLEGEAADRTPSGDDGGRNFLRGVHFEISRVKGSGQWGGGFDEPRGEKIT